MQTIDDSASYSCPACRKAFRSAFSLEGHNIRVHLSRGGAPAPDPSPPSTPDEPSEVGNGERSRLDSDAIDRTARDFPAWSRSGIVSLLDEARAKSRRHPDKTGEEIILRFWDREHRAILASLREAGAQILQVPDKEAE